MNVGGLSAGDIDSTNVLPAFLASVELGVDATQLARVTGWTESDLNRDGATVSGESTYRHMEFMHRRDDYLEFLGRTVARHDLSSLGVVGLACKTAASVADALALHARHQHITNRTAHYVASIDASRLRFTEHRRGDGSLGERLLSDFTLLVAHRLLSNLSTVAPKVLAARGRHVDPSPAYVRYFSDALGATFVSGQAQAEVVVDASILAAPVVAADAELQAYFEKLISSREPEEDNPNEPEIVTQVRQEIRRCLATRPPAAEFVARALGIGQRTMQRRLAAAGTKFAELLDDERRSLADDYLARPELSLSDCAYLLGFSEQASFFRAFRRWHDQTPDGYRRARFGASARVTPKDN